MTDLNCIGSDIARIVHHTHRFWLSGRGRFRLATGTLSAPDRKPRVSKSLLKRQTRERKRLDMMQPPKVTNSVDNSSLSAEQPRWSFFFFCFCLTRLQLLIRKENQKKLCAETGFEANVIKRTSTSSLYVLDVIMMSLFAELKKSIISLDAASLANHCSLNSLLAHKNVFFQYKPVFLLLLFQVVFQQKIVFFF